MKLLHIAHRQANPKIWNESFRRELQTLGELQIVENGGELSEAQRAELIRQADVLLTGWGTSPVPASIAEDRGQLKYICHITGTMRGMIPRDVISAGIAVTNWGDAPATHVAEGAVALLLAALKDLHRQVLEIRGGGWRLPDGTAGGSLYKLDLGMVGCGVIGWKFVDLVRPFGPTIRIVDPYATTLPDGCLRVDSLDELFSASQAIAIHAGLTDETRGLVTAEHLAKLPDYGVVVNTARGGIIDQDALFAELETGRLRAGLDVLDPDHLPEDHPARQWPNVIFSAHRIEQEWPVDPPPGRLTLKHDVCLRNLNHFVHDEPLEFVMDLTRYDRST